MSYTILDTLKYIYTKHLIEFPLAYIAGLQY